MKEIVLGIDPSLRGSGLGVISYEGRKLLFVDCFTIHITKEVRVTDCLMHIEEEIEAMIQKHHPTIAAIEAPPYCKSVSTMKKLSAVWGVAIATVNRHKIPVFEFSPTAIKASATGCGKAEKVVVQKWVRGVLELDFTPDSDSADALAAAITLANKKLCLIPEQLVRI